MNPRVDGVGGDACVEPGSSVPVASHPIATWREPGRALASVLQAKPTHFLTFAVQREAIVFIHLILWT